MSMKRKTFSCKSSLSLKSTSSKIHILYHKTFQRLLPLTKYVFLPEKPTFSRIPVIYNILIFQEVVKLSRKGTLQFCGYTQKNLEVNNIVILSILLYESCPTQQHNKQNSKTHKTETNTYTLNYTISNLGPIQ